MRIPKRYVLLFGTFLLTMVLFADRIAVSAAKVPIVGQYGLSDAQFGWVLAAFSLGYALFQAPGGAIADRFGPRKTLTAIVILWSGFTLLTGLAWGLVSLLAFRFLFGIAEGGALPACSRVIYNWLPARERALAQGINLSGTRLGAAFSLPVVAWIITAAGWRATFAVLAAAGVVWAVIWYFAFRDTPDEHPYVDPAELALIRDGRQAPVVEAGGAAPAGLTRRPEIYLLMGQYFASSFTFVFCLTWLFPYLQHTYKLSSVGTGLLAAMPLIGGAGGNWVGGAAVDLLYRRNLGASSRRLLAMLGFALAAIGLVGSLSADSAVTAVLWLTLAIFGADLTLPPSWAMCIDIGGPRSGTVSGMMNGAGNVGSFLTALAFPYLLAFLGSTTPFFLIAAGLDVAALGLWFILPMVGRTRAVAALA